MRTEGDRRNFIARREGEVPLEPCAVDDGAEVAVSARAVAGRAQAHTPGWDEDLLNDEMRDLEEGGHEEDELEESEMFQGEEFAVVVLGVFEVVVGFEVRLFDIEKGRSR